LTTTPLSILLHRDMNEPLTVDVLKAFDQARRPLSPDKRPSPRDFGRLNGLQAGNERDKNGS